MILLDTSIIIAVLRGEDVADRLEKMDEELCTCFPVECELYDGTEMARNSAEGRKAVSALLESLERSRHDRKVAEEYARLRSKYEEISDFDLMIAAFAVAEDAEIATRDEDFEEIEELEVKEF